MDPRSLLHVLAHVFQMSRVWSEGGGRGGRESIGSGEYRRYLLLQRWRRPGLLVMWEWRASCIEGSEPYRRPVLSLIWMMLLCTNRWAFVKTLRSKRDRVSALCLDFGRYGPFFRAREFDLC